MQHAVTQAAVTQAGRRPAGPRLPRAIAASLICLGLGLGLGAVPSPQAVSPGALAAEVPADNGAAIVTYHRFGEAQYPSTSIRIDQFEAHVAELTSGRYTILPLPEIAAALAEGRALPERTVGISIDDAFLSVLSGDGSRLELSSYLGGSGFDQGLAAAANRQGEACVGGWTTSTDFPLVNPFQGMLAGAGLAGARSDVFVTKLRLSCPGLDCGDCNLDGSVDVIDSLRAAQHSVGLVTLSGLAYTQCNVHGALALQPGAAVDVLDAFAIAEVAVGLNVLLICC